MDELDIPDFLRREPLTPEQAESLHRRMKNWKPTLFRSDEKRKVEYDREGHALPASLDAAGRALLHSMEKASAAKEKADKAERFRVLAVQRAEKAAIKKAAKAVVKR